MEQIDSVKINRSLVMMRECEMLVFRRKLLGDGEIQLDEGQRLTKYKREVTTLIGMCDGPLHVCAMRGIKAGR